MFECETRAKLFPVPLPTTFLKYFKFQVKKKLGFITGCFLKHKNLLTAKWDQVIQKLRFIAECFLKHYNLFIAICQDLAASPIFNSGDWWSP